MLNLSQIDEKIKTSNDIIEPNTLNLAGRSISYRRLKDLGWQSTSQTHPTHKTSTLKLGQATICLNEEANKTWFVEIGGQEYELTGGVAEITRQTLELLEAQPKPKTLLDLAIEQIEVKAQWASGETIIIWESGKRQAWLKNESGFITLRLFENALKLNERKYSKPLMVGHYDPQTGMWEVAADAYNNYLSWTTETKKSFEKPAYAGFPGDGGLTAADFDGPLPAETRRAIERANRSRERRETLKAAA